MYLYVHVHVCTTRQNCTGSAKRGAIMTFTNLGSNVIKRERPLTKLTISSVLPVNLIIVESMSTSWIEKFLRKKLEKQQTKWA